VLLVLLLGETIFAGAGQERCLVLECLSAAGVCEPTFIRPSIWKEDSQLPSSSLPAGMKQADKHVLLVSITRESEK